MNTIRTAAQRALACLLAVSALTIHAATVEIDRIVAVVNDDIISRTELRDQIRTVEAQLRQQRVALPTADVLRRQVLERMIVERIQLQLARELNILVDDEALNRAISGIATQNGLTLAGFRDVLAAEGYDFADFRESIRREMITVRLRQQHVDSRVSVTEQEVDNFLAIERRQGRGNDEYRLGHILVALPEAASPEMIAEARARADAILERLGAGEDFSQVAMAHSDGQAALEGGDLGWRRANEIPTLFADAVPQMSVGEVSEPIRSSSGFHLVKLLDHRAGERHIVEQTRARHILVRTDELISDELARETLRDLRARIEEGADFADLAREYSDDPGSASRGGDLGWVEAGEMVPEFERAMDELGPGEIGGPVQTAFGWHLVQVIERRRHDDTESFTREAAREAIFRRKAEEEHSQWLRRLRDEAYVEVRL